MKKLLVVAIVLILCVAVWATTLHPSTWPEIEPGTKFSLRMRGARARITGVVESDTGSVIVLEARGSRPSRAYDKGKIVWSRPEIDVRFKRTICGPCGGTGKRRRQRNGNTIDLGASASCKRCRGHGFRLFPVKERLLQMNGDTVHQWACVDCVGSGEIYSDAEAQIADCKVCKGTGQREQILKRANSGSKTDADKLRDENEKLKREIKSLRARLKRHDSKPKCDLCKDAGKVSCKLCRGTSYSRCSTCGGDGKAPCRNCVGRGTARCSKCNRGYIDCSRCDGRGQIQQKVTGANGMSRIEQRRCPRCRGKARFKCKTCRGTRSVTCQDCRGVKKVSCKDCNGTGTGKRFCNGCGGKGRLKCPRCTAR